MAAVKSKKTSKSKASSTKKANNQSKDLDVLETKAFLESVNQFQAVSEFDMDGTIQNANQNMLDLMGYALSDIQGKNHRMLLSEGPEAEQEYEQLWTTLREGKFHAGEFQRQANDGKTVWIQAAYYPILDQNDTPYKVVEIGLEITRQKELLQSVAAHAGQLTESSIELSNISQQMRMGAERTSSQIQTVSNAAEEVNQNMEMVATAVEEMTYSINEISQNAHEAAKIASNSVTMADNAHSIMSQLGDSSLEVGKVIKVITSIAQQTKLLALNATIEAARAGEAGKGFAVVANEVKELAKETAFATEDISQKIEAIQNDTQGAVEAISSIQEIINEINDIQNTIASSVEEQAVTTSEIGRNVAEAARESQQISKNTAEVLKAAQQTYESTAEAYKSSETLSLMANDLQELVDNFN